MIVDDGMGLHHCVALCIVHLAGLTFVGIKLPSALVVVLSGFFDTVGLSEGMGALLGIFVKPFLILLYLILRGLVLILCFALYLMIFLFIIPLLPAWTLMLLLFPAAH